MGIRIFEQPDGQYAVYSNTVDDFLLEDADAKELYQWYLDRKLDEIDEKFDELLENAEENSYVNTGPTSYEEAQDLVNRS